MPLKAKHFENEEFDRYQDIDQNILNYPLNLNKTGPLKKYMRLQLLCNIVKQRSQSGDRILDIGCSTGIFLRFMQDNFRESFANDLCYYGLDGNKNYVANANKWLEQRSKTKWYPNSKVVYGDIFTKKTWAEAGTGYDFVLLTDVIEHIPLEKVDTLLQLCMRAMSDDGYFIYSTPVHYEGTELYWPEMHDHEFTIDEAQSMLKRNGFSIEWVTGYSAYTSRFKKLLRDSDEEYKQMYETLKKIAGASYAITVVDTLLCTELQVPEVYFAVCRKR